MSRLLVILLLLSLPLSGLGGCASDKKKAKAAEDDKTKMAEAQHQVRQNPDKFESSDDPPISADTRFAAGQLQESQGDLNGAIKQYQAALKLDPNHKNSLYRLGVVYTTMKSYPDAILLWRRYLKATKESPAAYSNLGLCYEQAGQFNDAEQAYKAGIAHDPEDRPCRMNYGLMLARHNRMDEAKAQLATVLTPAEVQYNLGSVYEEQGKLKDAKACYHKALELDPKLRDAKLRLAVLK